MKLLPLGLVLSLAPAMAQQTSVGSANGAGLSREGGFWKRSNVVLIVLDDIGAELVAAHPSAIQEPPPTPNIGLLAAEGVSFTNAWGAPRCSPARASLLTGRFPFRHGVGDLVQPGTTYELPAAEVTIAERVAARGYRTAMFGKWHVTLDPESPCDQGFGYFTGAQGNLYDYWDWERIDDTANGVAVIGQSGDYNTSALTDAALAWMGAQTHPYFLMLSYNAAHKPTHCPPSYMQTSCTSISLPREQFEGQVESVDYEIGRLLSAVNRANTTLIVVGDNGTHEDFAVPGKSKGTVYRLGIEVPLIFWGEAVDRSGQWGMEDHGHVNVADLYRTLLSLLPGSGDAGMQVLPLDSVSLHGAGTFASSRAWNFAERFQPLAAPPGGPFTLLHRAVEDAAGYKLIESETGKRELYNTAVDPDEELDLLADGISPMEQAIVDSLDQILAGLGL